MAFDSNLCAGCPIQGRHTPVSPRGPEDARFLVVTEVPSQTASKAGRLLTDNQMRVFGGEMVKQGFEQEDFRFHPACLCAYDETEHTTKVRTAIKKHCRQHLVAEVEDMNPEVLIPLGAEAATAVMGKGTKIGTVRGVVTKSLDFEAPVFGLTSPGVVVAYPQNAPLFKADIQSFARYIENGFDAEAANRHDAVSAYETITDLQFLIDQDPDIVSFDMETSGLRWYQRGVDVRSYKPHLHKGKAIFKPRFQILTMQFTTEEGKGYMLVWDHPERPVAEALKPKLRNQLRKLLCKPERIVVGHNAKFDNVALWMTENIRYRIGGDSLMLTAIVDENAPEKNLDVMTKIHVPDMAGYADTFNAKYPKDRMWEVPLGEMQNYGCGDTDAAYRLYHALEAKIIDDDGLWSHYCNVSIPGLNALAGMETRGMHIDEAGAMAEFKEFMTNFVEEERVDLLSQIDRTLKREIANEYLSKKTNKNKTAADAIKLTRPEFTKEVLFTHPRGFKLKPKVFTKTTAKLKDETLREPSVSAKDHLPYFFDTCPFTMRLAEYIKSDRLLNTSVIRFEENYIVGGKVRPVYRLDKTVTGRTSSEDPNGQNYPKRGDRAKVYRKMFVPPPGYYVCELDLSQAELRIAASMSGDKTMIEIYRRAGDIHKATALIVMGKTMAQFEALPKDEQKLARTKAKAVNFGFLYGMGWKKFIGYAKTQYGVDFTDAEAKRIRAGFFSLYKALNPWHERVRESALKDKQVRSYSGRIRHLPMINSSEEYIQQEAIRQAINSPVQEFGSALGVMALGRMNDEIDPEYLQIVGFIHDAIVVYVKKEYLDWGMRTVKRYMQTNPIKDWFGVEMKVPIIADCGFGENLGDIIECEGFDLDKPFNYGGLKDKNGNLLIEVPRQRTPPNSGMLTRSVYTTDEDLEDENVAPAAPIRHRTIKAVVTEATVKRITRSNKQMVINQRNKDAKREAAKVIRRARRATEPVE
jgi:uracil-DNA glycosylase family 4